MNRNDLPKPNAKCEVCGKDYYRCAKCIQLRSKGIDTWKLHCDSKDCYKRYYAITLAEKDMISIDEFDYIIKPELENGRAYTTDMVNRINSIFDIDVIEEDNTEVENVAIEDVKQNTTVHKSKNKKIRHRTIENVK